MKRSFLAAASLAAALAAASALAYNTDVHQQMSFTAANGSNVGPRLRDIGPDLRLFTLDNALSDGGLYLFGLTIFEMRQPVRNWIGQGSIDEDNLCCIGRPRNHFFNPINGQGLSAFFSGKPSLAWALEPVEDSQQEFSLRDARTYLYEGITNADERTRRQNLSKMFLSLGHVIHLIQDLGQPQHTRNDSHATGSRYEKYSSNRLFNLVYDGYPIVQVTAADQLWTTPDFKGFANYTNRGFVTDGTNFTGTRSGNTVVLQPDANFPDPSGAGFVLDKRQITDPDLLGPNGPNQTLLGEIWFVSLPVTDANQGSTETNPRATTFSIFDEDLTRYGFGWTFTLNRFNFDAAHQFLPKRAVGYSKGLLNYFLRGQMAISAPGDAVYAIIDPTQSSNFPKLKFKVKNTTPNEAMAGGQLWAVAKYHVNNCYKNDLTGEPNGPNNTDVVGCRSRDQSISVSAPRSVSLASGAEQEFTFDFSAAPIPVNATDLFLQVIYRGPLGAETDAVAVASKDLFEPTHFAYMNGMDVIELNDVFYSLDQVIAGIQAGDPTFAAVDRNGNKSYDPGAGDLNVNPFDFFGVSLRFAPSGTEVARIDRLPWGRFARVTVITDQPRISVLGFSPPSAFNQVSDDGTTFFVTGVNKLRDIWVTDAVIVTLCVTGTTCNNTQLLTIKPSQAADATTPIGVTITQQFP